MKKLIIATAIALCAVNAQAESIAWIQNQAGGHIILTNEKCIYRGENIKKARLAITYAPGVGEIKGCWGIYRRNEGMITVTWFNEDVPDSLEYIKDFTWK